MYSSIFTLIGILDTLHSFSFTLLCLPQFGSVTCGGMTYVCTNVDPHKYGFYKLIMFCKTVWASCNSVAFILDLRSWVPWLLPHHGYVHLWDFETCLCGHGQSVLLSPCTLQIFMVHTTTSYVLQLVTNLTSCEVYTSVPLGRAPCVSHVPRMGGVVKHFHNVSLSAKRCKTQGESHV